MPIMPDVRAIPEPAWGVPDEPRPPATTVTHTSRITRTQQRDQALQTPLDLRCVRATVTTGFHEDQTPSLQCYPDGTFFCFGCRAGGSVYDFAARLWSTSTKGRDFVQLREQLTALLLLGVSVG